MKGALFLLVGGALLSLLIFRSVSPSQLLATLETQAVVYGWDAETARERLGEETLVVDGRGVLRGAKPRGALQIPFDKRFEETFALPEGREFRTVLVVMEAARANEARELAQWLAREWAVEVATIEGGFEAWQAAGLPVERR